MTMAQFSRDDMLIYQGREEGRKEERAEAVIELLEEIGELPGALRQQIMGQKNIEVLRRWHRLAAKAQSIEEFEKTVFLICHGAEYGGQLGSWLPYSVFMHRGIEKLL